MFEMRVTLQKVRKGIGEFLEQITTCGGTHGQESVDIKLVLKLETSEREILGGDRQQAEGWLYVKFE